MFMDTDEKPNAYYYRFLGEGEKQSNGVFTKEQHIMFMNVHWGYLVVQHHVKLVINVKSILDLSKLVAGHLGCKDRAILMSSFGVIDTVSKQKDGQTVALHALPGVIQY